MLKVNRHTSQDVGFSYRFWNNIRLGLASCQNFNLHHIPENSLVLQLKFIIIYFIFVDQLEKNERTCLHGIDDQRFF